MLHIEDQCQKVSYCQEPKIKNLCPQWFSYPNIYLVECIRMSAVLPEERSTTRLSKTNCSTVMWNWRPVHSLFYSFIFQTHNNTDFGILFGNGNAGSFIFHQRIGSTSQNGLLFSVYSRISVVTSVPALWWCCDSRIWVWNSTQLLFFVAADGDV